MTRSGGPAGQSVLTLTGAGRFAASPSGVPPVAHVTIVSISRAVSDRPPRIGALSSSDRKSTRLNSSHQIISYAVFCLKKKKQPTCGHTAVCIVTVDGVTTALH